MPRSAIDSSGRSESCQAIPQLPSWAEPNLAIRSHNCDLGPSRPLTSDPIIAILGQADPCHPIPQLPSWADPNLPRRSRHSDLGLVRTFQDDPAIPILGWSEPSKAIPPFRSWAGPNLPRPSRHSDLGLIRTFQGHPAIPICGIAPVPLADPLRSGLRRSASGTDARCIFPPTHPRTPPPAWARAKHNVTLSDHARGRRIM